MGATSGVFRRSRLDGWLVGAALAQGGLLLLAVRALPVGQGAGASAGAVLGAGLTLVALATGIWWGANTVSHNHLHSPLFRSAALNAAFSLYLSLLLGVPQRLWRSRHLWHHAGERPTVRRAPLLALGRLELAAVAVLWLVLFVVRRDFFLLIYAPAYLLAMGLCTLQGRYEHAGRPVSEQPGISCYGRLYNLLWFNDGYHLEHHTRPSEHWSRLPSLRPQVHAPVSRLPPVLRWLERPPAGVAPRRP